MNPNGPARTPDEPDLLAWVEGEALSAEANAAVARALMADPALAHRLELMRADRMALRSFGEERAPAGLIEAVESALQPVLERELLLGLQESEPTESNPVVSMVRPERRGIFQTFLADRAGRRMALAATLLLMIGGATWWAAVAFSGGTKPGPIALNDKSAATEMREATLVPVPETVKSDEEVKLAAATGEPDSAMKAEGKAETPEPPQALAAADAVGPVRPEVDPALAAELARERKLVIRVVSREAATSPRRVCDRVRRECSSQAWKLAGQVPAELTVALDVRPLPAPPPRSYEPSVPEPPAFAGSDQPSPIVGPPAPVHIPMIIEETEPQPLYVVQARLDATTMSQLKSSLERAGPADDVIFEERYEPLPVTAGGSPVLTPQAVLWWTNPPAGWTSWGEVPVVIEPK